MQCCFSRRNENRESQSGYLHSSWDATLDSSAVPKVVNLLLLPSVYSLILHESPLLSQAILQMTLQGLLPKVVPCLGQVWTLSTNALEDFQVLKQCFPSFLPCSLRREWSLQKQGNAPVHGLPSHSTPAWLFAWQADFNFLKAKILDQFSFHFSWSSLYPSQGSTASSQLPV